MTAKQTLMTTAALLLTFGFGNAVADDWQADENDRLQQRAEDAIGRIRHKVARSHP